MVMEADFENPLLSLPLLPEFERIEPAHVRPAVEALLHQSREVVRAIETDPAASPCAMCRQVMAEFAPPDFKVYFANLEGVQREVLFSELLPDPFDPDCLPR